jgi:hypothetical protein
MIGFFPVLLASLILVLALVVTATGVRRRISGR